MKRRPAGVNEAAERAVVALVRDRKVSTALETLLEAYGRELRGFVQGLVREAHSADEVWALVQEDLWRGLEGYRADASVRTWAYVVAQRACFRFRARAPNRRDEPLTAAPPSALVAPVHALRIRRERQHALLEALREELSHGDRTLLELRVDRGLCWEEVARALAESRRAGDDHVSTVALRKRFERIKERLRARLNEADETDGHGSPNGRPRPPT